MIDMTKQMMDRVENLNKQNQRISYQMSTGKVLQQGSDDSVLYAKTLDIEDNIRVYGGLKKQIEKTTAQNVVSSSTMDEIKSAIDMIRVDLLKSLNSGMDTSAKNALATNISGIRENLFTIVNTKVDGEYLFSGSDTTIQTFSKDDNFKNNGKVSFGGNAILRKVAVEPNTYRQRGVTAYDVLMYNSDTAGASEQLNFYESERIVDDNSKEWKITDTLTVGGTIEAGDKFKFTLAGVSFDIAATDTTVANTAKLIKDTINNNSTASKKVVATLDSSNNIIISSKVGGQTFSTTLVSTVESNDGAADAQTFTLANHDKIRKFNNDGDLIVPLVEIAVTNDGETPPKYTTANNAITGTMFLEAKHNYFDDLNIMINALKGYKTNADGTKGTTATNSKIEDILRDSLGNTSKQYDSSNIGHAELGGRNNIFNIALERLDAKNVHYNILMQKVSGADLSKLAMESKSLEMTYQALYSTVSKMHSLSLLNFMK